MKKKVLLISASIIATIAIVVGCIIYNNANKFVYNSDNAVGNTSGNLNNGGAFCEYNGKIYFSNPNDNGYLYSMNSDCTDAKKLNEDSVAYLNVCGDYIYYVKNNYTTSSSSMQMRRQLVSVIRTDLNGENSTTLYDDLSGIINLYGNTIYYQKYTSSIPLSLDAVTIDGKTETHLSDTAYNPSCIYNGIMYFVDSNNKNTIGAIDLSTNISSTFYDTNAYLVEAANNYLYYIDVSKGYALVRMNISTKTVELLYSSDGKIVNFNLYGNKIFFQMEEDSDQTGLYRMNADGTQVEFIAEGNLNNLQCTSTYTFFQYYEYPTVLYRVPTTGPITKVEEITVK